MGPALGRSGEPSDGHHFLPPPVGSAVRPDLQLLGEHLCGHRDGALAVGGTSPIRTRRSSRSATIRAPSARTAKRSSPTVSGRPSTTGSGPSAATAGAAGPSRATGRAGASTRSSATRGAAPTRGSRAVHERGELRPSRANTASTASSPIAR